MFFKLEIFGSHLPCKQRLGVEEMGEIKEKGRKISQSLVAILLK
jgi:hypothetical protein